MDASIVLRIIASFAIFFAIMFLIILVRTWLRSKRENISFMEAWQEEKDDCDDFCDF